MAATDDDAAAGDRRCPALGARWAILRSRPTAGSTGSGSRSPHSGHSEANTAPNGPRQVRRLPNDSRPGEGVT